MTRVTVCPRCDGDSAPDLYDCHSCDGTGLVERRDDKIEFIDKLLYIGTAATWLGFVYFCIRPF